MHVTIVEFDEPMDVDLLAVYEDISVHLSSNSVVMLSTNTWSSNLLDYLLGLRIKLQRTTIQIVIILLFIFAKEMLKSY